MAGKFELYTDVRGQYRFRLKAANGQIIAVGESYKSKSAALKASTRCAATPRRPWST